MAVRKTNKPVKTEESILRKTLVSMEKRLVTKIDDTSQSLKDYVDIRISLVRDDIQHSIKQLGDKLDKNTAGLVDLIERRTGEIIKTQTQVDDHEKRITVLEEK